MNQKPFPRLRTLKSFALSLTAKRSIGKLRRWSAETMVSCDDGRAKMVITNWAYSAAMADPWLADKEEAELKPIESYMPSAPTAEEIDAAITAALAETGVTAQKQMGVVMKATQAKLAGKRLDGKALSYKVRARLS